VVQGAFRIPHPAFEAFPLPRFLFFVGRFRYFTSSCIEKKSHGGEDDEEQKNGKDAGEYEKDTNDQFGHRASFRYSTKKGFLTDFVDRDKVSNNLIKPG
jgi:hypothetical protein